jgi:hypothetical protein
MKNHEEFKAAIFQKAERFEARRKARNKKILETAGLCSFALVITLSAYLGLFPSLHSDIPETAGTNETTQTSVTTENISTPIETTTAQTVITTEKTFTESTLATTNTTVESTVESTAETLPPISVLEFRGSSNDSDFAIGKTDLLEIKDYASWCDFLDEHTDDYPALEENSNLLHTITAEYFEEHVLLVIQYAGYDIIAFGSDMPQDKEDATETYTFYIDLRENRMNTRKQIHIMSVEKDLYKKTNIRVWNQDKN